MQFLFMRTMYWSDIMFLEQDYLLIMLKTEPARRRQQRLPAVGRRRRGQGAQDWAQQRARPRRFLALKEKDFGKIRAVRADIGEFRVGKRLPREDEDSAPPSDEAVAGQAVDERPDRLFARAVVEVVLLRNQQQFHTHAADRQRAEGQQIRLEQRQVFLRNDERGERVVARDAEPPQHPLSARRIGRLGAAREEHRV